MHCPFKKALIAPAVSLVHTQDKLNQLLELINNSSRFTSLKKKNQERDCGLISIDFCDFVPVPSRYLMISLRSY